MYHTNVNPKWPWLNTALWENLRCPLDAVPGGGLSPNWAQFRDDGAGSVGVYAWHFQKIGSPDVAFSLQMPHGYKRGTNINPHLHVAPVDGNAGKIKFGLEYTCADVDTAFGITTTVYVEVDAAGVAYQHQLMDFGEIAVCFNRAAGIFMGRLFRDNTVVGNYDNDVAGLELDLQYQVNTMGSRETDRK